MSWMQQKRKVNRLERSATQARLVLQVQKSVLKDRVLRSLSRPEVLIWSFSSGLLWELSRKEGPSANGGVRNKLTRMARTAMTITRLAGLHF